MRVNNSLIVAQIWSFHQSNAIHIVSTEIRLVRLAECLGKASVADEFRSKSLRTFANSFGLFLVRTVVVFAEHLGGFGNGPVTGTAAEVSVQQSFYVFTRNTPACAFAVQHADDPASAETTLCGIGDLQSLLRWCGNFRAI